MDIVAGFQKYKEGLGANSDSKSPQFDIVAGFQKYKEANDANRSSYAPSDNYKGTELEPWQQFDPNSWQPTEQTSLNRQLDEIKNRHYAESVPSVYPLHRPTTESTESQYLRSAINRLQNDLNAKAKDDKGGSGLASGLFASTVAGDVLSLGLAELAESELAVRALRKSEKGEKLSDTEQGMIDLISLREGVEQNIANRGGQKTSTQIGKGVGYSIPMMLGFAATSGIGSVAKEGVKAGAKGLTTAAAKKNGWCYRFKSYSRNR